DQGIPPKSMIVAGDSAGAHLALGCLLRLRDLKMPMPLLAIALSPPTDFETLWQSLTKHARYDWIQKFMLDEWAAHFCLPGTQALSQIGKVITETVRSKPLSLLIR